MECGRILETLHNLLRGLKGMTFEQIELLASKGEEPPKNLGDEEKMCWFAMQGLYSAYYAQKISREEAKERKRDIAACFRTLQTDRTRYFASCCQYMENIRSASKHKYDMVKATTVEQALDLALKTLSDMLGENMTEKAVRKSLRLEESV